MPKVTREELTPQHILIKILVEKSDYEPQFNEQLKKLQKQGQIKGFRKGKTPASFLKKNYGKKILADAVMQIMQTAAKEEIAKEGNDLIGQPFLSEKTIVPTYDPNHLQDFEFIFELGKLPSFELQGLDGSQSIDQYLIEVPKEKVEEQVNLVRLQNGTRLSVDGTIQVKDIITLKSKELENGAVKENGWETTFSIIVERLEDEAMQLFLAKQKGDTVRFNIFRLEKDAQPEYVKKYLLNFTKADLEEGTTTNEEYEAVIEDVQRLLPGELTQELLEKVLGTQGDLASEAELRRRIRLRLSEMENQDSGSLLFLSIKDRLMALNTPHIPLPEDFLANWLKHTNEEDARSILNHFDEYIEDMRWALIQNKITQEYAISISQEEVKTVMRQLAWNYFGGQANPGMEPIVEQLAEQLVNDQSQRDTVINGILTSKITAVTKPRFQINEVTVTREEMDQKLNALRRPPKAGTVESLIGTASQEEE